MRALAEQRPTCIESDVCRGDAYADAVKERLDAVLAQSTEITTWESVCSRMCGASPRLVYETALANGLAHDPSFLRESRLSSRRLSPELHPLDFEWYFTPACAQRVAQLLAQHSDAAVLVGTPTVAQEAALLGMRVTLVDRNPLVTRRFPRLAQSVDHYVNSIAQSASLMEGADIIFFDAPWYLNEVLDWLAYALGATREGALIALPLFPPLTRPSAARERDTILEAARRAGSVIVRQNALRYETPLFEEESIRSSGLPCCGNWRLADLLLISRSKTEISESFFLPYGAAACDFWDTFVIGSQVVKLRRLAVADATIVPSVLPLPGRHTYAYDSVSARDGARSTIDVWTSRNRVGAVTGVEVVREMLALLERGASFGDAVAASRRKATSREPAALEKQLRAVLGFETSGVV